MVKKVVIAAAGQGTRMQELTKEKSKHLIEVAGRPFLSYILDNLLKAGYSDITLVVGFGAELIKEFINKNNYKVKIINQFKVLGPKEKIYGTACPLMCVKDIKENFLYICGDNFYSVEDLKSMNIDDKYNYVAGIKSEHPEEFGVLVKGSGREFLKEIIEKPQKYAGNLINTSLYKFTPEIFEKVLQINKSQRGEYEITDAVSLLAKEKKVKIKQINDFWIDLGRPEDIKKFEEFIKNACLPAGREVKEIVEALKQGKILILPTDTVYGLVCDAENEKAVEKIFEIKKRERTNPLPVFVENIKMAENFAVISDEQAEILKKNWPGAVTYVLEAVPGLSPLVYKKNTIAMRVPDYDLIRNVLREFKKPLAQTSANISGTVATNKIKDVLDQFSGADVIIVDEGDLPENKPSTIIDLTDNNKIIRK